METNAVALRSLQLARWCARHPFDPSCGTIKPPRFATLKFTVRFFVGETNALSSHNSLDAKLETEQAEKGDVIRLKNVQEGYQNLAHKTLGMVRVRLPFFFLLKKMVIIISTEQQLRQCFAFFFFSQIVWGKENGFSHLFKVDDDTFLHAWRYASFFQSIPNLNAVYAGVFHRFEAILTSRINVGLNSTSI
jgi:hypothetical protein